MIANETKFTGDQNEKKKLLIYVTVQNLKNAYIASPKMTNV